MRERLASFSGLRVAVSPIVGNDAVRGPAGRIMAGLGQEVSVVGVARAYRDFCDVLVIDRQDDGLASAVAEAGAASGGHEHDYELTPGPYRLG